MRACRLAGLAGVASRQALSYHPDPAPFPQRAVAEPEPEVEDEAVVRSGLGPKASGQPSAPGLRFQKEHRLAAQAPALLLRRQHQEAEGQPAPGSLDVIPQDT